MTVSDWDSLVGSLRAVVLKVEAELPSRDVESIWSLIDAGEPGVAYENLCTQLFEYDVVVDSATHSQLALIGEYMDLDPSVWQDVERGQAEF